MSLGERAFLRYRWFVYDAGSRPVAVVAVLVLLGSVAAMAAALSRASSVSLGGFREWVLSAVNGFNLDVQLGVLIAAVLLVIDVLSGNAFPGQRLLFAVIVVVAAVGVLANIAGIVALLTEGGIPPVGATTTAEAWTMIIAVYLAPTVLAAVSGWVALTGARSSAIRKRDLG